MTRDTLHGDNGRRETLLATTRLSLRGQKDAMGVIAWALCPSPETVRKASLSRK